MERDVPPSRVPLQLLLAALACSAALAAVPASQACSLVFPGDFEDAWVGEDAIITNLGPTVTRIPLDSGQPHGLADLFFPSSPRFVVDREGRYVVHDDQEGLGADCSGHRYSRAFHANGTLAKDWGNAVHPVAAVEGGFVSQQDGRAHFVAWGTWESRELDLPFLEDLAPWRAAASKDGATVAFASHDTGHGEVYVHDLRTGVTYGPIRLAFQDGSYLVGMAVSGDGTRVAVVERGSMGETALRVATRGDAAFGEAIDIAQRHEHPWHVPLAWQDAHWAVAARESLLLVPEAGGEAKTLVYEGEVVSSLAAHGPWLAVLTQNATEPEGAAVRLLGPGWLELRSLRPQGEGWVSTTPTPPPPPPSPTPKDSPAAGLLVVVTALAAALRATAARRETT